MTEFFTSAVLRQTIKQVRAGTRDLSNPALVPYYRSDQRLPAADVAARASASAAFRQAAGLRPLSAAEAAQQIGDSGSRALFMALVTGAGIEHMYTEDLVIRQASEGVPELGDRTTYAQTRAAAGAALTVKTVRDGLRQIEALASRLPTGGVVLHVTEGHQPAIADDDSVVQSRLDQMWGYIRDLLP